uniref:WD_REPEATS_REGION domain-containing protein n=1 Tax=Caenorhabditis japonica TaxID=281687 RepID=A0A8R1DVK2_CAEJA
MGEPIREIATKRSVEAVYTGGSVRWSANGQKLFSTCTNVVKVIDLQDTNGNYTIGDPEDELRITCTAVDKNRNRLLIAYNNQVIREYSIPLDPVQNKPELARSWKTMHSAPILVMEFSEDGNLLATGAADHVVKVWNLTEQQCTHTLKGPSVVSAIVFGKNEKLVVGYIEGQLNLYNIMRGAPKKLVNEWQNHNSHITALLQIPESRVVVALSRDQTMSLHETETHETLKVLPLYESIESGAIGHNGNLFTVGEEGVLKEWVIDTAKLLMKKRVTSSQIDQLSYDMVSNRFLAVSAEQNLIVLDFQSLKITRQIVGFHDEIYSCCLFGSKESHMAVASNTSEIRIYNTKTLDCQLIRGHSESVLSVVSPKWDTSILISCSKDNSIIFWRLHNLNQDSDVTSTSLVPICAATGHANSVTALAVSNTAKAPFLASVSTDCTIKLWDLRELAKMKVTEVTGDGEIVDSLPKLTCSSTMVAHGKDVNCVDVSESDALIATGGMDKLVKLWQLDTNRMQLGIGGTLTGHRRGVGDVKFARSSHKLASCSGDMTVKIWNVSEKNCVQTITGHTCAVFRVLFVRNDTQIISADSAGIVKIWTIKTAECETSVDAHTDKVWSLASNDEESEFVTAGTDGRIVFWKDITEEKQKVEDEKRREAIEQDQTLTNLLSQKRYKEALVFALTLAKPYCAFKVISALISDESEEELGLAISRLDTRQTEILLQFCVKWNTNSRTSHVAQRVFFEIIHLVNPDDLIGMPNAFSYIESLLPYTQRHMDRLDRARQDVSLFDFVWKQMRSVV